MQHSSISMLSAVVFTFFAFLLGIAWAVMKRANKDYKALKGAVKPARATFWKSVGTVLKTGVVLAVALLCVVAWQVRDVKDRDARTPLVPAEILPSTR